MVNLRKNQAGQAAIEYILLLSIVVGMTVMLMRGLKDLKIGERITQPLTREYTAVYKYGHRKAQGPDEGEIRQHVRFTNGENSLRIFRRQAAR